MKYKYEMHNADFLVCNEDCKYYVPREPETEKFLADEVNPFAT